MRKSVVNQPADYSFFGGGSGNFLARQKTNLGAVTEVIKHIVNDSC